ncbi:MAG: hypothetical protein AAF479_07890 [Pseudomonadota bacterium]
MNLPKITPPASQELGRFIAEALMVRTADALIHGDFTEYQQCFSLPTTLESFEGNRRIENHAQLRTVFDGIRQFLAVNNVTELVRKFIEAEFLDAETLQTVHESYALNGSTLIKEPIPIFSVICLVDGEWRVTRSAYALRKNDELTRVLGPTTVEERASASA